MYTDMAVHEHIYIYIYLFIFIYLYRCLHVNAVHALCVCTQFLHVYIYTHTSIHAYIHSYIHTCILQEHIDLHSVQAFVD